MRHYYKLFFGIGISKGLGLWRFRVLIAYFGLSAFSAEVIFLNSITWFIYGYLVLPMINQSFIKDLADSDDPSDLLAAKLALVVSFVDIRCAWGRLNIIGLLALILFDKISGALVIVILLLKSINELLSLYNLWRGREYLYNMNTGIWNAGLIVVLYSFRSQSPSVSVYLGIYLMMILLTIGIHFRYLPRISLLPQLWGKLSNPVKLNPKKMDYRYLISTAFLSSFLAVNIWFMRGNSSSDLVLYSVNIKIPELVYSVKIAVIFTSIFTRFSSGVIDIYDALKNYFLITTLVSMSMALLLYAGLDRVYMNLLRLEVVDIFAIIRWMIVFYAYSIGYFLFRILSIRICSKKSFIYISLICIFKISFMFFNRPNLGELFVLDISLITLLLLSLILEFYENSSITKRSD
jgi:hypothetical protein